MRKGWVFRSYGQPLVQRRHFAIWQLTRSAKHLGSVSEDNRVIQALIQLVQRMMDVMHRCSVLKYDRTTKLGNINGVRKELLTRKGTCAHETLPPTKSSTRRVYQTSSVSRWPCMGPILVSQMRLPNSEDWC